MTCLEEAHMSMTLFVSWFSVISIVATIEQDFL